MDTYTFIITSIIMTLLPGIGVMYTVSTGLLQGKEKSIYAAIGCSIGLLPHIILSTLFSSLIAQMSKDAFLVIKIIGVLYLLYIGVVMLLSKTSFEIMNQREDKSSSVLVRGILINLLNPKLTLFFFSFVPQYVTPNSDNYTIRCILYGFGFMILTLVIFSGYGTLAGAVRKFIVGFPKRMDFIMKLFGIIIICFAIQLSFSS